MENTLIIKNQNILKENLLEYKRKKEHLRRGICQIIQVKFFKFYIKFTIKIFAILIR